MYTVFYGDQKEHNVRHLLQGTNATCRLELSINIGTRYVHGMNQYRYTVTNQYRYTVCTLYESVETHHSMKQYIHTTDTPQTHHRHAIGTNNMYMKYRI